MTQGKTINIFLTDDHMVVWAGLAQLIDSFDCMKIVAQAEHDEEALFLCQK